MKAPGKWPARGAGGATSLGGAIGLWPPAGLIILPLGILVYFLIGYASVTTISIAFFATILFAIKASWASCPGSMSFMALSLR